MYTLNIDHPCVVPSAANYSVSSLKPSSKSIISIGKDGRVVSVFSDDTWDLTPYAARIQRLRFDVNFGHESGQGGDAIRFANRLVWKRVMYWALYGLRTAVAVSTIDGMFHAFRSVVRICDIAGVQIDQLKRFPKVYLQLATIASSTWNVLRSLLARLSFDREILGFEILTPSELQKIGQKIPRRVHEQTAFIPDRIYFYILDRCEAVVDAYLAKQVSMERLYATCSGAYVKARRDFGVEAPISCLYERVVDGKRVKIGALELYAGGSFQHLAHQRGLLDTIVGLAGSKYRIGMQQFGSYLTNVALAARILIAAYSAARDSEHASLGWNCFETRDDDVLGRVHLLCGKTRKTSHDDRAYWTTSVISEKAVAAARSIARLRSKEAKSNERFKGFADHKASYLFPRVTDPWIGRTDVLKSLQAVGAVGATTSSTLSVVLRGTPKLFESSEMIVRQADMDQLVRMNPDISSAKFSVGRPWPLAWHQFRRTLVCHAAGAGVSIASTAWQLKHVGPWMAQHYRNNYFNLAADPDLADEFAKAQVEVLLIRVQGLSGGDFVPLVGKGKSITIRLVTELEDKALRIAARDGRLQFRETAPGVCTNPDACPFGGWEHVAECVKCAHGFAQRSKRGKILQMRSIVRGELEECGPKDAHLRESLSVQLKAMEKILRVTE